MAYAQMGSAGIPDYSGMANASLAGQLQQGYTYHAQQASYDPLYGYGGDYTPTTYNPTSTYNPYSSIGSTSTAPKQTSTPLGLIMPPSGSTSQAGAGSTSTFPFSTAPVMPTGSPTGGSASGSGNGIITDPMGPGQGGSASAATGFNPNAGVTGGTFSATQAPYQYGGKPQSDVNLQAQMNVMGQGNPFQNTAQGYANTAGYNSANVGGAAIGQGQNMYGGANAVMNTAFDPQNALYNKLQQQNTDQTNASMASRGITMSPYGAGVANQSNQDFNIAWQNAQLNRQVQGLGAAGTANTTGSNLGSTGVTNINNAGQLPYQTGQQALGNEQQSIQDWLNYLAGGTSASSGNQAAPVATPIFTQNAQGNTNGITWSY